MNPTDPAASRLAIVIPAWRARHFPAALDSLRNQTDRRFRLYIGDDGSPDDLRTIVDACTAGLDVVYHRFPTNLGGADLVGHWHRCIALSRDEPWLWLFSDDDIAGPDCVAAFHRQFEAGFDGATVLRFNLSIINESNVVTSKPDPHPQREEALECQAAMLTNRRRYWGAPDHIFCRSSYDRAGGFVNFPKALHADWATWVLYAADGHILTLPEATLRFRRYPQGTSSGMLSKHRRELLFSAFAYCKFCIEFTRRTAPDQVPVTRRQAYRYFCSALNDTISRYLRPLPGFKQFSQWRYDRKIARRARPAPASQDQA